MRPAISVVIPSYNASAYLAEAVESVHRQTRGAAEVIVVDDGSTDGSAALAARLDGVRVLTTPRNAGAGAARNVGTRAARGDVIAWLDADDRWAPTHLETVVGLLERHPAASVAFSLARQFGAKSGEWPRLMPEGEPRDPFWEALGWCLALPSATVVRREALLAVGGFDETLRVAEDFELWLRLARRGHLFVCSHAVTCEWRQHDSNTGADLRRYNQAEYVVRHRLWREASREASEAPLAARLAAALGEIWEWHLREAWDMRSRSDMAFHLAMDEYVPGAPALGRRWRRRALLVPLLPLLDRTRSGARRLGRALRGRAAG